MNRYRLPELYDRNGDLLKRWYVGYFYEHPETGKLQLFQHWISTRLKTKHARRVKANQVIEYLSTRLRQGFNPFQQENISFTNIVDALNKIIEYKQCYVKHRTFLTNRCFVNNFTAWLSLKKYDRINIESFNYQYALQYADYLKIDKGISNRTFNNYIEGISSIFNTLVDREYVLINPFKRIKKLPETERTVFAYSQTELELLKKHLPLNDPQLWLVCQFIFYCALRPSELVRLKIRNIDLSKEIIMLSGDMTKNRQNSIIKIPGIFVKDLMKMNLDCFNPEHFIFSRDLKPGDFQIWPTRLAERFKRFADKIGLKRNLYELKHTAVGLALTNGANINDLKYHCRHSDIKITEEYLKAFQSATSKEFIEKYPVL